MSSQFLYGSSQYSSLRTTVHKRKYFENGLSFLVRGHWALETYNKVHILYTSPEVQNHEIYVSGFRTNGDKIVLRRTLQNFFSCFWSQTAGGRFAYHWSILLGPYMLFIAIISGSLIAFQ
jgi:hypothetical protein